MPPFLYLVQNSIKHKEQLSNVYVTDNAVFDQNKNSLKVYGAYVDKNKLVFNDTLS